MQYKEGNIEKENTNRSLFNNISSSKNRRGAGKKKLIGKNISQNNLPGPNNKATNPIAITLDDINSHINSSPAVLICFPLEVINTNFSLSKSIGELFFTSKIADIKEIKNITPPNISPIRTPEEEPVNKISANIKFQKLSLLSLVLIKLRIEYLTYIFHHYLNSITYVFVSVGFSEYLQAFIISRCEILHIKVN